MKKLGFGFMRLPLLNEEDRTSIDYQQVNDMVDYFIDHGFTYFDTARPYHNGFSEKAIGQCLSSRYPRESFFLTTKMTMGLVQKEEDLETVFNDQLKVCGVDYFDNYLVHNMGVTNYQKATRLKIFEFVKRKKEEGYIKEMGFSFHDGPELLEQILNDHPYVDYVQLQINYIDWLSEGIQSKKCYDIARQHGKKVIVMEPIKGGMLASLPSDAEALFKNINPDLSIASWAIRFVASLEGVNCVLSGMSDFDQLKDNVSYMENFIPMNEEELKCIDHATNIIQSSISIPCTACEYCVKGCPKNIPIPQYFSLYNTEKRFEKGYFSTQAVYYNNMIQKYGKASDCISCGQCVRACPQHIKIIEALKDVAATFE